MTNQHECLHRHQCLPFRGIENPCFRPPGRIFTAPFPGIRPHPHFRIRPHCGHFSRPKWLEIRPQKAQQTSANLSNFAIVRRHLATFPGPFISSILHNITEARLSLSNAAQVDGHLHRVQAASVHASYTPRTHLQKMEAVLEHAS